MKRLAFIALLLMLGCQVGPPYPPPEMDQSIPSEWKHPSTTEDPPPCFDSWWEIFSDPKLNELEQTAVAQNKNLESALEAVEAARALAGIVKADLYPQLTINPLWSDQGMLTKLFGPSTTPPINPFIREHIQQFLLPLNLNYELDLWGFFRNRYASAYYNYQAEQEAYCASLLVLTAEVASVYYQIRALDTLIELYQTTIQTRKKAFDITKSRYDYKVNDYLAVAQAGVDLNNVQSLYYDAIRQRELEVDALAVLLGLPASNFCVDTEPLRLLPPQVPAGIPSDVLLNRPDIAQRERTRASQHALINVAVANFFPSFTLTGTLGYSSPDLGHFLKWISRYWAMGVAGNQMVFDGGRDCSQLELAWANFRQADADYQQTVLVAFQEVENALANLEGLAKESVSTQQAVEYAHKAYTISMDRYVRGVDFYLNVVDAERQELDNQRAYTGILEQRYIATIQLIKALGGGWGCQSDFTP